MMRIVSYNITGFDGRVIGRVHGPMWLAWSKIAYALEVWFSTDGEALDWQDVDGRRLAFVGNWPVAVISESD